MDDGVPKFGLISERRRYRGFAEALSALWEAEPRVSPLRLTSPGSWPRERRAVPAVFTSLLLHFAVGYFFYNVPLWMLLQRLIHPYRDSQEAAVVVYKLEALNLADYLPVHQPPAPGAAPGRGNVPGPRAPRGSAIHDPRVQVISNPPNPDNFRQTILQPNSPPKLTIPRDIPLPNLILAGMTPPPEAPKPPVPQPKVAAEIPAPHPKVILKPAAPPVPPDLALVPKLPPLPSPRLEVPVPPPVAAPATKALAQLPLGPPQATMAAETPAAANKPVSTSQAAQGQSEGTAKLVSLSLNPVPLGGVIALPPGNRLGAFSIAAANGVGSPGGGSETVPAGTRGSGAGGDASLAAGTTGTGGGGPGDAGTGDIHSVTGDTGSSGLYVGGSLPPLPPEKLVYAVDETAARLHRPSLVVSTSSGGGGGLEVYGVLKGRKVYTIYLPMPGKSWILQFCASDSTVKPDPPSRVVQIQMEPLLVPPAAVDQFDFHRPPVQIDKPDPMIILHGAILQDGSVGKLQVLKGFGALIDEAAAAAFARWKFTPALRAGSPVAVEILVGIPALAPGS